MKRIFISQPMRNRSNEEILEERKLLAEKAETLLNENVEVISSFMIDIPHEAKPLYYLSKSISYLSLADVAIFAPGWDQARGCKIEHLCAQEYNVPILID